MTSDENRSILEIQNAIGGYEGRSANRSGDLSSFGRPLVWSHGWDLDEHLGIEGEDDDCPHPDVVLLQIEMERMRTRVNALSFEVSHLKKRLAAGGSGQ